jgi:hypothetical protein
VTYNEFVEQRLNATGVQLLSGLSLD